MLVDYYDDDWSKLWWIRIRGRAEVYRHGEGEAAAVLAALAAKYHRSRARPPEGAAYRIAMDEVRSWRPTTAPESRFQDVVAGARPSVSACVTSTGAHADTEDSVGPSTE